MTFSITITEPAPNPELEDMRLSFEAARDLVRARKDIQAARAAARLQLLMAPLILASDTGTPCGSMVIQSGSWDHVATTHADATEAPGTPSWFAALGPMSFAVLTSDGNPVDRGEWCACDPTGQPGARFEVWGPGGLAAEGGICGTCRCVTPVQTGPAR